MYCAYIFCYTSLDYTIYIMSTKNRHMHWFTLREEHTTHWHSTHLSFSCFVHICLLMAKCCLSPCLSFLFSKFRLVLYLWLTPSSQSTPLLLFLQWLWLFKNKVLHFFPIINTITFFNFPALSSSSLFIFLFTTADLHLCSVLVSLPSFKLFNPQFLVLWSSPLHFLSPSAACVSGQTSLCFSLSSFAPQTLPCLFSSHVGPNHPGPPRLSFSPRRQYFLDRSPGYSSQGIRGPPLGEDVAVTMEVASGAYHRLSIYFGS